MGNVVTPSRNIRVADELWAAAKAGAEIEGTTISAVINQFLLEAYGRKVKHYIITRGTGQFCAYCDASEASLQIKNDGKDPRTIPCDWYHHGGSYA